MVTDNDEWIDVRMTDPEEGEWDADVIVLDGEVQCLDLRIRPELLGSFVECLVGDAGPERARAVVERLADRHGLDVDVAEA